MNSRTGRDKDAQIYRQAGDAHDTHRGTGASVVAAVQSIVCCMETIEMTVEIQCRREPLQ